MIAKITPWKDDLSNIIKHQRIPAAQVPQALLNWFARLIRLIKSFTTRHQFDQLLAAAHLPLPQDFQASNIESAEKNLAHLSQQVAELESSARI